MTQYQPRHRRSHGLRRWLTSLTLAAILVIGLAISFRTDLVEFIIISALENQGFGPVVLDLQTADFSSLEIGSINLDNGQITAKSFKTRYSITELRQGKVTDIRVEGLLLQGAWAETGLTFPLIDRIIASQRKQGDQLNDRTSLSPLAFDRIELIAAGAIIEHPKGPVRVSADIAIEQNDENSSFDLNGTLNGPDIQASTSAEGTIDIGDWLSAAVEGALMLEADEFLVPGQKESISADLQLSLSAQDGELSFGSIRDVAVSGPWPSAFGGRSGAGQSFDVSLLSNVPSAPFFKISSDGELLRTQTNVSILWATPLGRGSAAVVGWATIGQDGIPQDFNFSDLNLLIEGAPTPVGALWANISADGLRGPLTVAEGPVLINARLVDGAIADLSFAQFDFDAESIFRGDGLSLAFSLSDVSGQMLGGTYGSQLSFDESVSYSLAKQTKATQTASLVFGADGSATATFDAALQAAAPNIRVSLENSPLFISPTFPELAFEGYWASSDNTLNFTTSIQNAEVNSELGTISNISSLISGDLESFSGPLTASLRLPNSSSGQSSTILKNEIKYADNSFIIEGIIETISEKRLSNYSASYQSDSQLGKLEATVGPMSFGGSGLSPSDLRPLSLPFTPTSGQLAAAISMPFGAGITGSSSGSIYVEDLELEANSYAVRLLNTAIELKSIWPIQTDGPQKIAIGLLQAGVPTTDILATFDLSSAERIGVTDVTMSVAEGRLSGGPFSIELDGQTTQATLQVEAVSLPALANLSTLEGLDASGLLSGRIPLRLTSDGVFIDHGKLTTSGPGHIRYRPGGAAGALSTAQDGQGGMGLALQALENFQYDSITVTVNGSVLDELEASLAIKGRNPSLYNGYPIDFNLNLSGELANVIQGSLAGYRVPETIKRQLMAFPPKP